MQDDLQSLITRMVAAGESEEDIALVIQHHKAQPAPAAKPKGKITDMLPSVAAGAASFIGGKTPLSIPLAGIAGAAGSVARDLFQQGSTPPEASWKGVKGKLGELATIPGRAIKEGATQAGIEAAGGLAGKALSGAGRLMYRGALRPAARIRAKYPDVIEQGLKDNAVVGGQGAKPAMLAKMNQSKRAADTLVDSAQGSIPRSEVRKPLVDMARQSQRTAKLTGTKDEAGAIIDRARKLQPSYSLKEGHEAARSMNDRADKVFRAERMGGQIAGVDANMDKVLANAFSGSLKDRIPGLAAQNKLTSDRYGLAKALGDAAERPSVLSNIGAATAASSIYGLGGQDVSDSILGGAAVRGITSPRVLSLGGIAADKASKAPISNIFRLAMLAALADEQ